MDITWTQSLTVFIPNCHTAALHTARSQCSEIHIRAL